MQKAAHKMMVKSPLRTEQDDDYGRVPVPAHAEVEDEVEVGGVEKVEHLSKMKNDYLIGVAMEEEEVFLRKQFLDLRFVFRQKKMKNIKNIFDLFFFTPLPWSQSYEID